MNIRLPAALGFVLLPVLAIHCGKAETAPPPVAVLRASGTTARDLDRALKQLPGVIVKTVTPGGSSVTSLQDLQRGTTDIGIAMADVTYLAFAGQLEEPAKPFDQLRGMAVLNLNILHLLASAHSNIRSLADLRGRHVALGPAGSATALIAELLLGAHAIDLTSVRAERLPYPEAAERLASGELDAAFMTQIPPSDAVMTAARGGARVIDVDGPVIEELRRQQPFLKRAMISRDTYPGQTAPVHTVGVDLVLVCRADLDDELVYRLLSAFFATRPGVMPATDLERAPATPLPLHPGAARYYRQRELSR